MDDTVPPFFGAPIVVRTGLMSRFTAIAVDAQVKTTEGKAYDVLFVGELVGLSLAHNAQIGINLIDYPWLMWRDT